MAQNDAVLDTFDATRQEAGVSERANQQLSQNGRSFYAGAFDGSTPLGALKGNRVMQLPEATPTPLDTGGIRPFKNLRGGNRK